MSRRTIWDNDEAASNERARRRFAAEARAIDRMDREDREREREERAADAKIGQLCREGQTVHYINLLPLPAGRTKEGTPAELRAFLIRNRRRYL
jgi:hypothetical protein